jgi:hypothetical protein
VGIPKNGYHIYNAVTTKYTTIMFKFVPMGKRQVKLEADGDYILTIKKIENTHWSFGSCHSCWKKKNCSFTDTAKTPRPYDAKIKGQNLSVMGGCGCLVCTGCVLGVETYTLDKDRGCSACPYCGHTNAFPKDLCMWRISEQVELSDERKFQME